MSGANDAVVIGRRARRGRAWWEQALARMQASGMSLAEFSQQEGIGYATLRRWRARLKTPAAPAPQPKRVRRAVKFLALPIAEGGGEGNSELAVALIEVQLEAGMRLHLSGPAAARVLDALLRRIERPAP